MSVGVESRQKGLANIEGCEGSTGNGSWDTFLKGLRGTGGARLGKAELRGSGAGEGKIEHAKSRTRSAGRPSDESDGNVCKTCTRVSSWGAVCCLSRQAWLQDKARGGVE